MARGDSLNAHERAARDEEIVRLKARGLSAEQVAQGLGIHTSTVWGALKRWKETGPKLRNNDPLEIVDEMLDGYQSDLAELATVSATTKNESVRVGAINARMAARDRIIALLQATGVLPHDLGKLRVEVDVRYIATRVLAIFDQYGMPMEAKEKLLELLSEAETVERPELPSAN